MRYEFDICLTRLERPRFLPEDECAENLTKTICSSSLLSRLSKSSEKPLTK